MAIQTKETRKNKELKRLQAIYKNLPKDMNDLIQGLINRAAYMRVTLEDFEKDLDENGHVELFSQSDKQDPYERERPVARLYNTMNKNYQSIIRQLSDLQPKQETVPRGDGFDDFVNERDE